MIEIWGKTQCPHCEKAKQICEMRGLAYTYKQLGVDFEREQVLEEFPGARTFPQIKVNGDNIGGCDQFVTYLEETNYNGTGETL
jgi:glutaredoxin